MDRLEKLHNAAFVVFMVLVIYIFFHYYFKNDEPNKMDADGDGVVTKKELADYMKKELELRSKTPPSFSGILRSAMSGALRGACMGLILNGVEGAITSAIVLGMINPIITGVEHAY